jgi:hypothetical protein
MRGLTALMQVNTVNASAGTWVPGSKAGFNSSGLARSDTEFGRRGDWMLPAGSLGSNGRRNTLKEKLR